MTAQATAPSEKALQFVEMVARLSHRCDPEQLLAIHHDDSDTLDSLIMQAREVIAAQVAA